MTFRFLLAAAAAAAPALLAYNVSPSPTYWNQALAFGLWAGWLLLLPLRQGDRVAAGTLPLQAALVVLALAVAGSWAASLAASLAVSSLGTLLAAAVMVAGGARAASGQRGSAWFGAFAAAWLVTTLLNIAVALVQVFLPDLPDGTWLAHSSYPGRAVGNLRQPNHLSSLLLWGCIAIVALLELNKLGRKTAAALLAATVFAVVLTASRTGLVSVVLLAVWGLADRKLSRPARVLLVAAPVVYAVSWLAMAQWAALSQHSFGGTARLAETDISSSRFAIWRDTLALVRAQPWLGVGFGEFNLAWTLTPSPHRPTAFFDHTHNLPLQLVAELGVPLAVLVMGLLGWALWRCARNAWATDGATGSAQRCALMMVLMIGLHSLLEYPLWYSYFLLPAAWAWGFALQRAQPAGDDDGATPTRGSPWALRAAALTVVAGAVFSVIDYTRVAVIFSAEDGAPPLEQRIARGQKSVFFAHHADYAAVTSGVPVADPAHAFDRAVHYLLDTRLMMAWAKSLAAQGRVDLARHLAARLREFRKEDADEFFAACPQGALPVSQAAQLPFQCQLPERPHDWREFLAPAPRQAGG